MHLHEDTHICCTAHTPHQTVNNGQSTQCCNTYEKLLKVSEALQLWRNYSWVHLVGPRIQIGILSPLGLHCAILAFANRSQRLWHCWPHLPTLNTRLLWSITQEVLQLCMEVLGAFPIILHAMSALKCSVDGLIVSGGRLNKS